MTNFSGPLTYPHHDGYNILGELTIIGRMKVESYGSANYWGTVIQKRANGSSNQTNCPFSWGCYNYYNYGGGELKFSITRSNAGGYRQFNGPTEEHYGSLWKNYGISFDSLIQTAPSWYMDGVLGAGGGQGTAGSGSGAATGNTDVLYFGDTGGTSNDTTYDWLALFARKLSAEEINELVSAPFGEVFEPETSREFHDLWSPYIPTASQAFIRGMSGGFNTGLNAGFR